MENEKKEIDQLLHKVEKVVAEQKEITTKENLILESVATTEKEEVEIEKKVTPTDSWQRQLLFHARRHEILFPLIIAVGVVLVWRGLWGIFDQVPFISYSIVSLLLGIFVLWVFNRFKSL